MKKRRARWRNPCLSSDGEPATIAGEWQDRFPLEYTAWSSEEQQASAHTQISDPSAAG